VTQGCTERLCNQCCKTEQCPVHYAHSKCTTCKNRDFDAGCTANACQDCCDKDECPVHPPIQCNCSNVATKQCTQKSCAYCCKHRYCPAHSHMYNWCVMCNLQRVPQKCPLRLCYKCCTSPTCPSHGGSNVQKFVTNYNARTEKNHKMRKCVAARHIFVRVTPRDENFTGNCSWCPYKSMMKSNWICTLCHTEYCSYCFGLISSNGNKKKCSYIKNKRKKENIYFTERIKFGCGWAQTFKK